MDEKILAIPLLPAGTLSSTTSYSIHLQVWTWTSHGGQDDDLTVAICDGTYCAGLFRMDTVNPEHQLRSMLDGAVLSSVHTLAVHEKPDTREYHAFSMEVLLDSSTEVLAWFGSPDTLPVSTISDRTLHADRTLFLSAFANHPTEQPEIIALDARITELGQHDAEE